MTAFRRHAAAEQRIAALAAVLGQAADRRGLDVALESLGLPDTSDPVGLLALWLAGPYRAVPRHAGWWSPDASKLVRETEAVVSMGGGVHPYEVLIKDLIGIGVTEEHAAGWLARQRVRIEHGVVVDLRGRVRDIAERALEATGRSMTQGELCSWLPIEVPDLALVNELRKNPRFIETGPGRWELADWGGEPSAHLVRVAVPVTPEVMAGDQAALAGDLACLLGLPANDPVTLVTRFGPMTVTYDGARVMRGTARPVALASGAAIGDVLWFVIDPRDLAAEVTIESADPAG